MTRRFFALTAAATVVASLLGASPARADANYPNKPIQVILPFAPGGPTDVVGRVIATEMGQILGQPLVIETRPGASGTIGAAAVARAPADGYQLLMNASVQVIYPGQFKTLTFDPMGDFTAVGVLGTVPMVAIVPPDSPYASFQDIIQAAKDKPGALAFASPGVATLPHLVGELVNTSTGAKLEHVGYRGSNPALTDVAGGHVQLMYAPLAPAMPLIQAGRVKPLAVTTGERLKDLPNVPTIAETVLPGFDIVTWYGLWAPKGTPEAVVEKLNQAMVKASSSAKVAETLAAQGTIPSRLTHQETQAFAQEENQRWIKVMQDAGIQPE
ncbi:tripartite tricarboxylate transporter substrate binding protein [Achromobacter sp. GG226]|uniref:Bug family tripartite tricarboxylate transporter substrate binding protein n=1 Tax=Verticiella alkaliphila TaxID=2779529 RepID=UPI001C0BAEF2|nr:tripartite tricarboxylate transporter substrate binding protein [Verticiella sp. GG226]MBU4611434.1 tripartite tricarboxylate transporter substrate binding protein [Verticiella sp. GG226]